MGHAKVVGTQTAYGYGFQSDIYHNLDWANLL